MSCASKRQTTPSEDIANSLMGIFDVNIPILYGEGSRKAFRRLQKEIMENSFDQSIFLWRGNYDASGIIAHEPSNFANTPPLGLLQSSILQPFSITNVGLAISLRIGREFPNSFNPNSLGGDHFLAALECEVKVKGERIVIHLQEMRGLGVNINGDDCKVYHRMDCASWFEEDVNMNSACFWPMEHVVILEDEHYELAKQSDNEFNLRQHNYIEQHSLVPQ